MINIIKRCPVCGGDKSYDMNVTIDQIEDWKAGTLIQNAMPQLEPDEREVFITGMCYDCQSQVFQ